MKRYIRSATIVNANNIKIVPEQVIDGITIRIRPFLTEQSVYDAWLQNSDNYRIVQTFVANALNCAIEAAGDDKDSYDYYLNMLVDLNKLHYGEDPAFGDDRRSISCHFGSALVNPKWYSSGRGGHSSEGYVHELITDISEHDDWSFFLKECKRVVREVHTEYRALQRAQDMLKDVPGNIIGSLYTFKHWIITEKLGGNEVNDAGEAWLLSRTYENSRGSYYHKKDVLNDVTELFDWLIENRYTYDELKQLVKAANTYVLRSPQRRMFDYDDLTNH
ncbi:MAG: hypothetical protein IJE78_06045 [Bacteroidaceae bacterium]|nr:hypothetical protein [Bacteroidaceae bacterium]